MRISQREFARHLGVSHTAVQKAIRNGRIAEAVGQDKKVDLARAKKLWVGNQDLGAVRGGDIAGSSRAKPKPKPKLKPRRSTTATAAPAAPIEQTRSVESSAAAIFSRARAEKEVHLAQRARLAYEREAGQLVTRAEVARDWFEACRQVRDGLLAIPDRVSGLLANREATDVYEALTNEIRLVLGAISESLERESKRA